jgi:hypothetical protein
VADGNHRTAAADSYLVKCVRQSDIDVARPTCVTAPHQDKREGHKVPCFHVSPLVAGWKLLAWCGLLVWGGFAGAHDLFERCSVEHHDSAAAQFDRAHVFQM